MNDNEINVIKKWISSGADLELLSMEFDMPMNKIMQYKDEMEKSKNETGENRLIISLSEQIQDIKNTKLKKGNIIKTNQIINELENCSLTIEQVDQLYNELSEIKTLKKDEYLDKFYNRLKRKIDQILAKTIDNRLLEANNLEELKEISKRITYSMCSENQMLFGTIKYRIQTKIQKLQQIAAIDKAINNIPSSVVQLAYDIAYGKADIDKVNSVIDQEAQKKIKSESKTKFALTYEQVRDQFISQIRYVLRAKSKEITINDPIVTIDLLNKLSSRKEIAINIETIVKNYIDNKEFAKAKKLCDRFCTSNDVKNPIYSHIEFLRKLIKNKEKNDSNTNNINKSGTKNRE